jgi:electron transport complex protein RnfD
MKRYEKGTLVVSSSPHISDSITTSRIMRDVLIALVPALLAATYYFGPRVLILVTVCILSSLVFEYLFNIVTKREHTIDDLSAVVTGTLLAFNLPSNFPYWMAILGCFIAIVIVKQLFGGIGQNFVNPAITARVILLISFATPMTSWPTVNRVLSAADAVTAATPLFLLKKGDIGNLPTNFQLLMGGIGGSLGETCALALIIGGLYLIYRKVISITIPLSFLGTMVVFSLIVGADPVFQILAGGAILGAFFMATDYSTSPITNNGKIIFGIGCGLLTMMIRLYGSYPEGVSFAILFMNILTPHIDNLSRRRLYGGNKNE